MGRSATDGACAVASSACGFARQPLPAIRPEARFVTLAVREPEALSPGELHVAASAVRDWAVVVELAARHGVAGYVREAAARESLAPTEQVMRALQAAEVVSLATVMAIDVELARVTEALCAQSVPSIVLKGPVLARTIYPRRALRPYGDIDLTVQDRHQAIAARTLAELGYTELAYAAEDARRAHLGRVGHIGMTCGFHRRFVTPDDRIVVELHTDPLQLGLRPVCEAERWHRAVAAPGLDGALMLAPEDQVVHLCTHLQKHGFERLIWLKDIDLLLRAHRGHIDWGLVHDAASAEGVLGSVWFTLHFARELLGAPVPCTVLDKFRPSAPLRVLYERIWPMARIAGLEGFMRRRAVQFHAAESWRGTLPSVVLMGRRADRVRAAIRSIRLPGPSRQGSASTTTG